MNDPQKRDDGILISKASDVSGNAYAPYSGLHVGAAVRSESGRIYMGCNVENASYGLTVCAERVAILSAVANGEKKLDTIAIVSRDIPEPLPCGACLQLMSEFGIKRILIGRPDGYDAYTIGELLPKPFRLK